MPLLELKNVASYYGSVQALKSVSLRVEQGEVVTLLGANGAGKSTTLRTISGLLRPDELALLGELSGQVQSALTRLSPDLREAVILRDLQQLEYSEIQQVLAVPEGTVKSRINRGRIELARILQQMGVRPS